MLTLQRKTKLNDAIKELRKIPGLSQVWSDDYDSAGINIFFELKGGKFGFEVPIRTVKQAIAKVCNQFGGCNFRDQPAMKYEWVSGYFGSPGYKQRSGYDGKTIKIDLYI